MRVKINGVWYEVSHIEKSLVHNKFGILCFVCSIATHEPIERFDGFRIVEDIDTENTIGIENVLDLAQWMIGKSVYHGSEKHNGLLIFKDTYEVANEE